jgi:hypothetical protein
MEMAILMDENIIDKTFLFFAFFLLFVSLGNAQEQNENNALHGESYYRDAIRLYKHALSIKTDLTREKLEESPDIKEKIDYLISRGYSPIDNYVDRFYDESIYKMVYHSFYAPDGYLLSEFEEDGIVYILKYRHQRGKPRDTNPNFYTVVTIADNNFYLRFIKINYFLEYHIEEAWQYIDDESIYIRKIFY